MAIKFGHLHVKTPDPQKTAKWYVENLGAKIMPGSPGGGVRLELDGVSFNVTKFYNDQSRLQYWGLEHFGIRTDEFDTVMKKLKVAGARVLEESKNAGDGHRIAFIETPEAVKIEVSEILKK